MNLQIRRTEKEDPRNTPFGRDEEVPVSGSTTLVPSVIQKEEPVETGPQFIDLPSSENGVRGTVNKASVRVGRPVDLRPSQRQIADWLGEIQEYNWLLAAEGSQPRFSVFNHKGGVGKTPLSLYVGSELAETTRSVVVLLPTSKATKSTSPAYSSGVLVGDRLAITDLSSVICSSEGGLERYRDLSIHLCRTRNHGLRIVVGDPEGNVKLRSSFGKAKFVRLASRINDVADMVVYDHGNDSIQLGSIVLAAAQMSDVLVGTVLVSSSDGLKMFAGDLLSYQSDSIIGRDFAELPDEEKISTSRKIDDAIVVFVGLKPHESIKDYQKYLSEPGRNGEYSGRPISRGKVMAVPFDPYIHQVGSIVDLNKINPFTRLAYARIASAILEQTAQKRIREGDKLKRHLRSLEGGDSTPRTNLDKIQIAQGLREVVEKRRPTEALGWEAKL